jgi:hypothetical protein
LAYLVNSRDGLEEFLRQSGVERQTMRARAEEPEFLASLLDFLLANEGLLAGFLHEAAIDVRTVHMARHVLAGG